MANKEWQYWAKTVINEKNLAFFIQILLIVPTGRVQLVLIEKYSMCLPFRLVERSEKCDSNKMKLVKK